MSSHANRLGSHRDNAVEGSDRSSKGCIGNQAAIVCYLAGVWKCLVSGPPGEHCTSLKCPPILGNDRIAEDPLQVKWPQSHKTGTPYPLGSMLALQQGHPDGHVDVYSAHGYRDSIASTTLI